MKLLVIGQDLQDLRRVKNFTGVYTHYLSRELRKRGVELCFIDGKHPDPIGYLREVDGQGCDHVLAMGLRWFTHKPLGCANIMKTKVPGAVTQLHDGLVHDYLDHFLDGVDCTFMFRDDAKRVPRWERYAKRNHHIGWAADPDLLFPMQRADELRILIDHPYYKDGQPDITEAVTQDVLMFAYTGAWKEKFAKVRVRRLINGGAEDVSLHDPLVKKFERQHVPYEDIAREYRLTTLYMVTHKESVGLTCLELATCGAFVAASKGLVYPDRLATIRHVEYGGVRAPWGEIISSIDIRASVEKAREQRWSAVADRMLRWFEGYK